MTLDKELADIRKRLAELEDEVQVLKILSRRPTNIGPSKEVVPHPLTESSGTG
jgi:hypothetical protein